MSIMQSDCPADQTRRDPAAARLVGQDAKKVEAVKVIRINAESVFVAAFSFRKLASAMMPVSSRQQLGNLIQWTKGPDVIRGWRAQFGGHSPLFSVH
jgi:hypothetical protein